MEMYMPDRFFSMNLFIDGISKFSWPGKYEIFDELPDSVMMVFPKCTLYFYEGFDGDIGVKFDHNQTKTAYGLDLVTALLVLRPEIENTPNFEEPEFINNTSIGSSPQKVEDSLHDVCVLLQTYLMSCIQGDFSWVERYKNKISNVSPNQNNSENFINTN